MMWIEKYRPIEYSEVMGLPDSFKQIASNLNDLPHLLLVGPPGTGKTTSARIIINKLGLDYLELNASDERGIQTVRDKIKSFAMTSSMNGKIKAVFLDEMDGLTPEAQTSLRNTIERYHNNCRFICTANYENKIIDALQSRLTKFVFKNPNIDNIGDRLLHIATQEKLLIEHGALLKIINSYYPDMRKMVNKLQELKNLGKEQISSNDIHVHDKIIPELWQLIGKGDFINARQLCLDSSLDYWGLLDQFKDYIMANGDIKPWLKTKLYHRIGECLFRLHFSAIPAITFEDFILYCIEENSSYKKALENA